MSCPAGCALPSPPFPLFSRRPNGLSVCQSNLIHSHTGQVQCGRKWRGFSESTRSNVLCPGRDFYLMFSAYHLSCDILATLTHACIAPPVWSAFHSDPPAATPRLYSGLYPESYPQTVRIATSKITALSWFLPFNLLLFPLGSQPCTDTAFSTVSVPY